MAALIEGAGELALLMALLVALAFTILVTYTFEQLANVLDIKILTVRPFHGVATGIRNTIIHGLNVAIASMSRVATNLFNGLVDSLAVLLGALIVLALSLPLALEYLAKTLAHEIAKFTTAPVARSVAQEEAARKAADVAVNKRLATAETQLADARSVLATQIEPFLRWLSTQEIPGLDSRVDTLAKTVARLEGTIALPAPIPAPIPAPLPGTIPFPDVDVLKGTLAALGVTVATIAAESGLERAECRQKVKQICTTDPSAWGQLLGGLTALTVGLSLAELLPVARHGIDLYGDVVKRAS